MSAIELNHITKNIKGRDVLNAVSLSLEKGKIYGFVGHNGSGKSMLFRLISGLVKPTTGEIKIFGEVLHKTLSFPRSISVILEKPGFLEQYSGFDNLKFLADIQKKITDQQIKEAIDRVGLDPNDKRGVKTYSLGMKQKLAIAQAIMEKPEIMLLDEPMNGLDEDSVKNVYNIIQEQNKRGATILITSHHKEDIEALCDEVYKVNSGNVVKSC
ncbi:ABC transporter ATP-binding protein [Bacillus haynesii]|uniref:ABC transporter ATP-binding protein n=1 Tax=Bacillus haynesii TaxID=1925021 RepID=UPI0022818624|nr:ABC transporter ATP-binding protein [Bacillus haynesii]MCY8665512.1 ABC transporter ATP-binding protein [Bacillus haynesii]MEC1553665.1 ABC transporter ATP-binding protein [Bacillus haynesii]